MSAAKPDPESARPTPLGIYDKPRLQSITSIEVAAIVLSVLWLGASLVFFFVFLCVFWF